MKKNNVHSETQTYSDLEKSNDFRFEKEAYMDFFTKAMKGNKDIVGVVVVTGNEVKGCDIFATNKLFMQQYEQLLHSYITEAITNGATPDIFPVRVMAYVDEILGDKERFHKKVVEEGQVFQEGDLMLHISTF